MLQQTIYTMQIDIARDLHDTVGQNIGYLRMRLAHLSDLEGSASTDLKTEVKSMSRVANETYDLLRGTLSMLQTEDSASLSHLFERYAVQIEERSTFSIQFKSNGEPVHIPAKRMRQLFYIYREVLSNIEKHAAAQSVVIEMTWETQELLLSIRDDGKGFNPDSVQYVNHYGLKFMKERVEMLDGKLSIHSVPNEGTTVSIHMPYDSPLNL
jgi:signal transduction histidine kinase